MDKFDSRALKFGDSITQQFSKPGKLTYRVGLAQSAIGGERNDFVIEVVASDAAPVQHFVKVFISDGALQVEPPRLKVSASDTVLWSAIDRQVPPFRVRSTDDSELAFDSAAIRSEAVLSHAFGVSGTYRWTGVESKLTGEVVVVAPKMETSEDVRAYQAQLASLRQNSPKQKGTQPLAMFTIDGDKAEPPTVSIVTGQTVLWVVKNTTGIALTL